MKRSIKEALDFIVFVMIGTVGLLLVPIAIVFVMIVKAWGKALMDATRLL